MNIESKNFLDKIIKNLEEKKEISVFHKNQNIDVQFFDNAADWKNIAKNLERIILELQRLK